MMLKNLVLNNKVFGWGLSNLEHLFLQTKQQDYQKKLVFC